MACDNEVGWCARCARRQENKELARAGFWSAASITWTGIGLGVLGLILWQVAYWGRQVLMAWIDYAALNKCDYYLANSTTCASHDLGWGYGPAIAWTVLGLWVTVAGIALLWRYVCAPCHVRK